MKTGSALLIAPVLAGLVLVPACNSSSSRSPSYSSPQEVFNAASGAAAKEDWETFSNCLTEDSRNNVAGMLVISATFMKAFGEMDKTKGKERFKPVDDALKKHGVTDEMLKSKDINPINPDANAQRQMIAKLAEPIKDKAAFIGDMMRALKQVSDSKNSMTPLEGELKDVKVDGDTAKGTYVSKKGGKEKSEPIEFRKVDGGWKIELPMTPGASIQGK